MLRYLKRPQISPLILCAVLSFVGCTASAETQRCKFDHWKGAKDEDASISWMGTGFEADTKKSRIRQMHYSEKTEWIKVDVKETSKFTSFNYSAYQKDINGNQMRNLYGYRIYNSGKCKAYVSSKLFEPMEATGRLE